jgi:hypothetical protein
MQANIQRGLQQVTPPSDALSGCGRQPHRHNRRPRGGLQVVAAVKRGSDKTIVCSKTVVAKKGSEAAVQDLCQQVGATGRVIAWSSAANRVLIMRVEEELM